MPVSVTMPRLGESVTEGTVTRWLKSVGDQVEADEPLLEVSTDKVDTEIPAPASGVLTSILVGEDETAEIGSDLAVIAQPDEAGGDTGGSGGGGAHAAPAVRQPAAAPQAAAPVTAPPAAPVTAPAAPQAPAAAPDQAAAEGRSVTMPALGESVTEGTVTRWLKSVGDQVEADEPLLEVSTDKVDTEIPAPASGVLTSILVGEDETAAVGATLATIGAAGTPASAPVPPAAVATPAPAAAPVPAPVAAPPAGVPQEPAPSANGKASQSSGGYVTPLVRKLATEQGVDLTALTGTGVGGRIRRQDVLDAAERQRAEQEAARQRAEAEAARQRAAAEAARQPAAKPAGAAPAAKPAATDQSGLRGRTEKMSRTRAVIARRMVESLQVAAQLTTVVEVDVTNIARLRNQVKNEFFKVHGAKLSFMPFFALAAIEALRVHPKLNASIDQDNFVTYYDAEHLGIAVDTDRGLMVPVIRGAGDLSLAGLARRIGDLADRTRRMKIEPDELSGGTFTLTNTGSRGALFDTPIINQPQVAILGTGSVVKRAVVVDDPNLGELIVPRSMVYLALSYDHRLVDGADAARFLGTVKQRLEAGQFAADLGI